MLWENLNRIFGKKSILSKVLQGSVLGALLFTVYITDLGEFLLDSRIQTEIYKIKD